MRSFKAVVETDLFGDPINERPVNVASVPQRSPFRYPGGKTWLVPRVRQWLANLTPKPTVFVEPFAGGGIISLTVAFEKLADKVIMVELDDDVMAVWQTILSDNNEWLAKRIEKFDISLEAVQEVMATEPANTRDRAFRTIVRNRTYHGGILAHGSAPIKAGENGKGIKSRWYAQTLARRIRAISDVQDNVELVHGDGIAEIKKHSGNKTAAFFIDPPYTAAGKRAGNRLYTHHALDHEMLFKVSGKASGDVLMTYDNAEAIAAMGKAVGFESKVIPMKNTHNAVMSELLIGRDLSWV